MPGAEETARRMNDLPSSPSLMSLSAIVDFKRMLCDNMRVVEMRKRLFIKDDVAIDCAGCCMCCATAIDVPGGEENGCERMKRRRGQVRMREVRGYCCGSRTKGGTSAVVLVTPVLWLWQHGGKGCLGGGGKSDRSVEGEIRE